MARPSRTSLSRRGFLTSAGAFGVAAAFGQVPLRASRAPSRLPNSSLSALPTSLSQINHIIVDCQENRSFDHYYGFAEPVQRLANAYAVPVGYSQSNGSTTVTP